MPYPSRQPPILFYPRDHPSHQTYIWTAKALMKTVPRKAVFLLKRVLGGC